MLNQIMATVVATPHLAAISWGILFTAILFLVYGVFGILEKRPRAVNIVLAILAIIAGVLLILGK